MNTRLYIGYLCIALGFAFIMLLGYGVIDPIGMDIEAGAGSIGALLQGLLPSALVAAVAVVLGLYLVRSARKP
ncbi:hypothetical protein ACW7G0_00050 [Lysobacter sp. A286]